MNTWGRNSQDYGASIRKTDYRGVKFNENYLKQKQTKQEPLPGRARKAGEPPHYIPKSTAGEFGDYNAHPDFETFNGVKIKTYASYEKGGLKELKQKRWSKKYARETSDHLLGEYNKPIKQILRGIKELPTLMIAFLQGSLKDEKKKIKYLKNMKELGNLERRKNLSAPEIERLRSIRESLAKDILSIEGNDKKFNEFLRQSFKVRLGSDSPKYFNPKVDPNFSELIKIVANGQQEKIISKSLKDLNITMKEEDKIMQETLAKTPMANTPLGKTPLFETPLGKMPIFETPLGKTPLGKTPLGKTPLFETPLGKMPILETPLAKTPLAKTPMVDSDSDSDVFLSPIKQEKEEEAPEEEEEEAPEEEEEENPVMVKSVADLNIDYTHQDGMVVPILLALAETYTDFNPKTYKRKDDVIKAINSSKNPDFIKFMDELTTTRGDIFDVLYRSYQRRKGSREARVNSVKRAINRLIQDGQAPEQFSQILGSGYTMPILKTTHHQYEMLKTPNHIHPFQDFYSQKMGFFV